MIENTVWIFVWALIIGIALTYVFIILNHFKKKERPKKATSYKCMDGDTVKSRGEVMIDNLLTKLDINHIYEKRIQVKGNPIKCDWYLTDYDIYIEYWGGFDKEYLKRKKQKIKLYKKGILNLVSIEDIDLKNIYKNLPEKLSEYIDIEEIEDTKYCPNCGKILDSRF
ncbi:MAG: helicase IV [Promethearchaeota archaeon]|nr:MAG: helicase IV [Candidatus Lokiarchaeota archaeon]